MIIAYIKNQNFTYVEISNNNQALLKEALWIDVISPTETEVTLLNTNLEFTVPTREKMLEIELSSRLYQQKDILFMTASMIAQSESKNPTLDPVTLILTPKQFITVRYINPQAFILFKIELKKLDVINLNANDLLIKFLDVSIDRLADILENISRRLDDFSQIIFKTIPRNVPKKIRYHSLMQDIGSIGNLNSKVDQSIVMFNRLITFVSQANILVNNKEKYINTFHKDLTALSEHSNFLSNKVIYLLDATIGMVTIEQNNILKVLSVAASMLLPPTFIAAIYGMNFHMPELNWKWGYVYALTLMAISAILPFIYLKYRKWI